MEDRFFWPRFCVYFVFGAALGAAVLFAIDPTNGVYIGAAAVAVGLVSAVGGDRFWLSLKDLFRHWWP